MLKLAVFSPLNPQPSGISDYTEELLPRLARGAEVDLYVDGFEPSNPAVIANFKRFDYARHPHLLRRLDRYDAVLYQFGNDPRYHAGMHAVMREVPGIVVLHDFAYQHFFIGLSQMREDPGVYLRELEACEGALERSRAEAAFAAGVLPPQLASPLTWPLNQRLVAGARGVIVHSAWAEARLKEQGVVAPVAHIPLLVEFADAAVPSAGMGKSGEAFLGSFGLATPEKGIERTLRCLAALRAEYAFRYWVVGGGNPHCDVAGLAERMGLADRVTITGHVPFSELRCRMAAMDIGINLREGTVGETSASLIRLLAAGVPCVVTDVGGFHELPEDCVVKIPAGAAGDAELERGLRRLLDDPLLRVSMGARARAYAAEMHSSRRAGDAYLDFISAVVEGRAGREPGVSPGVVPKLALAPAAQGTREQPADVAPGGRLTPLAARDYRKGALEYVSRLNAEDRHYLLTKPFHDLATVQPLPDKPVVDGMVAETHRYFCDFANLAQTLRLPAGARIADVGCGSGWLAEFLARLGYDVTGFDVSPDLIALAEERLTGLPFGVGATTPLRCRFVVADIESEPQTEKFDAVVVYDALHHFEDERAALRNLAAMLVPGGLMLILEGDRPAPGSPGEQELVQAMEKFDTLESPFDRDYLRAELARAGLTVIGDYIPVNGLFEREMVEGDRLPIVQPAVNCLLAKKLGRPIAGTTSFHEAGARLSARWRLLEPWSERAEAGAWLRAPVEVENIGDRLWLADGPLRRGNVTLGIVVRNAAGAVVERTHGVVPLPRMLAPGDRAHLRFAHRAPMERGRYTVSLDLVAHQVCWFTERGSQALDLELDVT
jgi:glycosyltransferase involved in cell wall biosynthesis/2-polyprenyl-3-methyl-5-hydroxy-6-metoxy-1,4-benzoquinol methylase